MTLGSTALLHRRLSSKGLLPLSTNVTSIECGLQATQGRGLLPLPAIITSTDGSNAEKQSVASPPQRPKACCPSRPISQALMAASWRYYSYQNSRLLHHRQESHGLFPSLAHLTSTDGEPQ